MIHGVCGSLRSICSLFEARTVPILTSFGYVLVQKSDNHHQNVPADTACSTLLGRLVILEYAHTVRPSAQLQEVGVK